MVMLLKSPFGEVLKGRTWNFLDIVLYTKSILKINFEKKMAASVLTLLSNTHFKPGWSSVLRVAKYLKTRVLNTVQYNYT